MKLNENHCAKIVILVIVKKKDGREKQKVFDFFFFFLNFNLLSFGYNCIDMKLKGVNKALGTLYVNYYRYNAMELNDNSIS